jgi:cysteine desulfurase family protein
MIYLDNAATSFPKPPEVAAACLEYLEKIGASPGRSGHRPAAAAGRILYRTRKGLAELFNFPDPGRIIFCENATGALNLALFGLLGPGDRVLVGPLEHNSVMRPLRSLEEKIGLEIDILPPGPESHYDLKTLARWCRERDYRLAVFNQVSNVTGTIAPLEEILPVLRENGIVSVVDGAQSAGCLQLDLDKLRPDIFCFTGHKGLFGPPGTGGLCLGPGIDPEPLKLGGTGSRSEEELQPAFLPDRYESGTPNTMGLAGLGAGIDFILKIGQEKITAHERKLAQMLRQGLEKIAGITLHGPRPEDRALAVVSFTASGLSPAEIGFQLDREYAVMTRVGLHCAPRAHRTIGTFPTGTVRLAPGWFNTEEEIATVLAAIAEITGRKAQG